MEFLSTHRTYWLLALVAITASVVQCATFLRPPSGLQNTADAQVFRSWPAAAAARGFVASRDVDLTPLLHDARDNPCRFNRCHQHAVTTKRTKRFAFMYPDTNSRIKFRDVTYRVLNGSTLVDVLNKDTVEEAVAIALAAWAPHCGLNFIRRTSGAAHINFSFEDIVHSDGWSFAAGTLAHNVYYADGSLHPSVEITRGAIHFSDPLFRKDYEQAYNFSKELILYLFYHVALHEIGHALGLNHSNTKMAVMYGDTDLNLLPTFELHDDDIQGMETLYRTNPNFLDEQATTQPPTSPSMELPTSTRAPSSPSMELPTSTRAPSSSSMEMPTSTRAPSSPSMELPTSTRAPSSPSMELPTSTRAPSSPSMELPTSTRAPSSPSMELPASKA